MKFVVVNLLAVAVFASLICRASFERFRIFDKNCPTYRRCQTFTSDITMNEAVRDCTCFVWGCLIDEVYYSGVGCIGQDQICKNGANEDLRVELITLRDGICDPYGPKKTITTISNPGDGLNGTVGPNGTGGHKSTTDATKTTTNGINNSKYGTWKITGMMILIGCFFFLFDGCQQQL